MSKRRFDFSGGDVTGLNLTRRQNGDAVFLLNAGLETQAEASNGYLWIMHRYSDPLYEALDQIDASSW